VPRLPAKGEADMAFSFAFQPIVDVRDQSTFAHEALVRGVQGEGALSVLQQVDDQNRYRFDQLCRVRAISTAAQLGLTGFLRSTSCPTRFIARTCASAARWRRRAHAFPLERLIFEAVEGEHVESNKHLMNILREYREFGFKTAIDDFGAGYSGLNLLADFQPDLIKLDMALIRGIHRDRVRQAIVRGVVGMCTELGIEVIAEGIEHRRSEIFSPIAGFI
jgi:EAL domain-containing protein (putative c-di-GMP-specific phosphodiesterase class I)